MNPLSPGQTWIKGNRERKIIQFNEHTICYQTKKDVIEGMMTEVGRNTFRCWLDGARLKVEKVDLKGGQCIEQCN